MWRYNFVFILLVFIFAGIVFRLFYWQVVRADELSLLGKQQYGKSVTVLPRRGDIKTSDNFPIATNKTSYLVFVQPKIVKDKEKLIDVLSKNLELDAASVSAKLETDRLWVSITSHIDIETKDKLAALSLDGVGFEEEYTRFYPEASLSSHLVGFVGKNDAGDDKGYFGIEGYYDRQLRGKEGNILEVQDAFGHPILSKIDHDFGRVKGRSLVLNIDRTIQFLSEQKLKAGMEKYNASGGMVLIMEPATGNVLAMAAYPSFDPRYYSEYPANLYKNPIISSLYEPGSTFKTLVMSAGIDSGVVKPETKCPICAGPITIADYEVRTWNNKYYKDTTMIDVIQHSDNTGMVYVSKMLGLSKMLSYFKAFGIDQPTGIDLQGEIAPELRTEQNWYAIDVATASFGQGISITPMGLLDGFSAIANNGVRMEPHVVSKIITAEGQTIVIQPKTLNKPISQKTAKVMTEILVNAVNNGEAKYLKPKGYRIAGKTGTAQIPIAGHYDPNKTVASFIGFAPADDPKFAMLVIFDRPTTSIYGSETAAPVFMEIAKNILSYYGIPPKE